MITAKEARYIITTVIDEELAPLSQIIEEEAKKGKTCVDYDFNTDKFTEEYIENMKKRLEDLGFKIEYQAEFPGCIRYKIKW